MKLQQLRYLVAVIDQGLNVSAAAQALYTSQPGISKQIRLLEQELGVELFRRRGKHLSHLTTAGEQIAVIARRMLANAEDIRRIGADHTAPAAGELKIATTHTQARYALPGAIAEFRRTYPDVELDLYQGTPDQLAELANREAVDLVIATEALELFTDLVLLPCYRWNRCVLVPAGHPLADGEPLTLQRIAAYPLVTYVFAIGGHQLLEQTFGRAGLRPRVALSAVDTDVIKTYVRQGLGVGIIASMAYEPQRDADLRALDAAHLFPESITMLGLHPDRFLRGYVYDFAGIFAPHLTRDEIRAILEDGKRGVQSAREMAARQTLPSR